ncbi:hypothetical protein [Corynebacterium ulcerans]|uniref:hypothetical protein n=1 Tax=Corynebacterium ulcerans TaxID=65058 RepID=UPI000269D44D|nr:hypothetical protein [Corynebacterium ulcerans]ESU57572.1 hypothetical protein D881_07190 [Corynebacterium ulcerans NCTC 12077]SQG58817.1 Uncharacterised protein [Corynebacterium ulcerans]BAM27509.1 hypothetical protein CULC0102_1310 [Corynebacterium ulcerans 0102]BBJ72158.1 hypothetical protein CULC0211_12920 [Corynebacterium ulcerans]BBJ74463.1 hypothetical protein CULCFH20161_12900 [Corynebacterium ulcerans]
MLLLNLNEIDRVKRLNNLASNTLLAERTDLSRKTWSTATTSRKPTIAVLNALVALGANPARLLVVENDAAIAA